ncbi:hypothetical protein R1sor_025787 [Riccia sorocarpa]|uniref:Uncharacterized protein n=1 Tax=Riccia sorocarpa TaxID=122646 RepID=A0ABD3GBN0_9MARC
MGTPKFIIEILSSITVFLAGADQASFEGRMAERTPIDDYFSYFQRVETQMLKPESKCDHPATLVPSHLDHLHMDRYVPILFIYKLNDRSDAFYNQFVNGLKDSLAKVLVSFYPVAGAVTKTSDPHHPRTIVCDDTGVPFTEAYKDEPLDQIVKNHEPVGPLSGLEAAGLFINKQCQEITESGVPCFVIQVTRFKCGGVCIGISWNHMLADMAGAMVILRAWADTARKGETTIVPQLDRTILSPQHSAESEPTAPPPLTPEERAKLEKVLNTRFDRKILHIRKEKIDEVKQAALQDGFAVSTTDCLCAHLWRCVSRHIAESGESDVTIFSTAVEGRAKMGGTLTSHYIGNVVVPAFVRNVLASEIVNKPLVYAARKACEVSLELAAPNLQKRLVYHLTQQFRPRKFRYASFSSPFFIERLWADPEFTSLS